MRTIYLRKDYGENTRKVLIDMAYLVSHKKIRLLKTYYDEGLYLPFFPDKSSDKTERYYLTKDKITSEGKDHYFFNFPFKANQVENAAD